MAINKSKPEDKYNRKVVISNKVNKTAYDEVYGIEYFHQNFKNKYPATMYGGVGKINKRIPIALYEKIFTEYWDIYFKEIYFTNTRLYFLYSGTLEKVLYRPRIIKTHNVKKRLNPTIGFFWSERLTKLFTHTINLKKLTGTRNRLPKLDLMYKKIFDINLIANFEDVKTNAENNQTYFRP